MDNSNSHTTLASQPATPAVAPVAPVLHLQPVAPDHYTILSGGTDALVQPADYIAYAATLADEGEARALVADQARAVFTRARMGRQVGARHYRDHVRRVLDAGYRASARFAALLDSLPEWIVTLGGDQPRTPAARLEIAFYCLVGLLALASDFIVTRLLLLDVAPEAAGRELWLKLLAVAVPPVLAIGLLKGYPMLRHATLPERAAWQRRFAPALWPACVILILAAAARSMVFSANPTADALAGVANPFTTPGALLTLFALQLAAQAVAGAAAFGLALQRAEETRPSSRRPGPDRAATHAKLEAETTRLQQNRDTLGWVEALCAALDAEETEFVNDCLAALAAQRDARRATLLEIGLLRRGGPPPPRFPASSVN